MQVGTLMLQIINHLGIILQEKSHKNQTPHLSFQAHHYLCLSSSAFFPPTCSLINPSTHPSTSSALCVSHSHHFSVLVSAGGALLVTLGGVGLTGVSSNSEGEVSSSPDADAAMLAIESTEAGMVANKGVAKGESTVECVGGSAGVSSGGAEESLW
jgi:hypothetical protein